MGQICDICEKGFSIEERKWSCSLFSTNNSTIVWDMYSCQACERQMIFRIENGKSISISNVAVGVCNVVNALSGTISN